MKLSSQAKIEFPSKTQNRYEAEVSQGMDFSLRFLDEDDYEGFIDQIAMVDGVQKVKLSE